MQNKQLQKRVRLILDKLDQPDADLLASKLLSIRMIAYAWPGMPASDVLQQFSLLEQLTEEDVMKVNEILKKYE